MGTNGEPADLFAELEDYRCAQDWTYLELAENIATVTRRRRDEDCWRRICNGLTTKPQGRTLDILKAFLVAVRPSGRRRMRRAS